MEEEEQRLVWKLKVGVRLTSFSLKLSLQNRLSSWKLHRLSFLVRFRKHRLQIDSQSQPETNKPKSKFRKLLVRSLGLFKRRKRRECQSERWVDSMKGNYKLDKSAWIRSLGLSKKALGSLGVLTILLISFLIIMRL